MAGAKKRTFCAWAAASVLIAVAVLCRFLDLLYIHSPHRSLTRSAIYIFLFAAWAVYARNRIIHARIRCYLTAVFCLMYAATLELCIHCALIPSNNHYREMFDASTVGVQITDANDQVFLSSAAARPVPEELLKQAKSEPVMLDKGLRLCAADIRAGHVLWQEDVSELLSVLSQLNDIKEELQGYSALLEKENRQKQRAVRCRSKTGSWTLCSRPFPRQKPGLPVCSGSLTRRMKTRCFSASLTGSCGSLRKAP